MKKRFISVFMIFVMLFAITSNSLAYSRAITFTNNEAYEIHAQNMPAGSFRSKIGVSGMTSTSGSPDLLEVLYGPGFTVSSKRFTVNGYVVKNYSLAGLTYMHFSAEKYSVGNISTTVLWDYNF